MMRKLLIFGWLFGVPVAIVVFNWRVMQDGTFVNVGPEVAARIRPYMMIAEVEAIVGGPPGDYSSAGQSTFTTVSGCCWEHTVVWVTDRGRLEVVDGRYGSCCDGRNQPRGIVDSVRWMSATGGSGKTNLVPLTALCFTGTFGTFAVMRWLMSFQRQPFGPVPRSWECDLELPRYPE